MRNWIESNRIEECKICKEPHIVDKKYDVCIECWQDFEPNKKNKP